MMELVAMRELHQQYDTIQTMPLCDLMIYMNSLADSAKETNKEMQESMGKMRNMSHKY
jgi:hypothetical protein